MNLDEYEILIRHGRIFWLGQLRRTHGIPCEEPIFHAWTRLGIEMKMRDVRRRRVRDEFDGWEVIA